MERNERFPSRLGECAINRCSLLAREGFHLDSQRKVIEAYVTLAVSVRSLASRSWSLNRIAYPLCRGRGVPGTPDRPEAGSGNSRTPEIHKKSFTAQPPALAAEPRRHRDMILSVSPWLCGSVAKSGVALLWACLCLA